MHAYKQNPGDDEIRVAPSENVTPGAAPFDGHTKDFLNLIWIDETVECDQKSQKSILPRKILMCSRNGHESVRVRLEEFRGIKCRN